MQAKRETNFFIQNVEKYQTQQKIEAKRKKKRASSAESSATQSEEHPSQTETSAGKKSFMFKQRDTEDEILARKRKSVDSDAGGRDAKKRKGDPSEGVKRAADNKQFLRHMFTGGVKPGEKPSQDDDKSLDKWPE